MSDNEWDDSESETPEVVKNPKLVADLRAQRDAAEAARVAAETELAEYRTERRETALSTLFEKAGKPKAAVFYPKDAETSPEAVGAWMTANADTFGFSTPDAPAIPSDVQSAYQQINGANSGALDNSGSLQHAVETASYEDLLALIAKSKGQ